jgi:inosine-uridine nucleoside N-ribohydrolase
MYPGEINLLCLGPLTTIAAAYMLCPGIEKLFKSIFMMGGSTQSKGNVIPASEFNFAYDFIAAKIVMTRFSNIFLTPWEPTEELLVRDHNIKNMHDKILGKNKKVNETLLYYITRIIAKFTADKNGTQLCDLYSVITAFEPRSVTKFSRLKCDVIIDSIGMIGMLYVKSIKEIKIPFDQFLENVQHHLGKFEGGSHIVIEELCEITIYEQYEQVLTL